MPRVHSSQRQKNKPFKTKKTKSEKTKHKTAKTKPIGKHSLKRQKINKNQFIKDLKYKKEREVQKLTSQNQYLDLNTRQIVQQKLKHSSETKIIVLVPGNQDADPSKILTKIFELVNANESFTSKANLPSIPFENLLIQPSSKSFIKNKLLIISGRKNIEQPLNTLALADLIKCADIICTILSCRSTNIEEINLDPKAFDQTGYLILNMIRSMGTPTTIGIVQHLEEHKPKHHNKIQNLFKRFISSELGENDRITYLKGDQDYNGYNKLMRQMDTTSILHQSWKSERGYMLVQNVSIDEKSNNVTFHGFLKGNCVNANQLVHVTGFEDYAIEKIQIHNKTKSRKPIKQEMEIEEQQNIVQYAICSESLFPFSRVQEHSDDLLSALEGLKIETMERKQKKQNMEEEEHSSDYESQSESEEDCNIDEYFGDKEEEKQKRLQMQMRKQDELEFDDQVEYAAEQVLREKFKEYQGLKNFKTDQWNHLQNLPDVYDRIYTFKQYQRTSKVVQQENVSKAFAYPGFYISVTIVNFPVQKISNYENPLILTFLMKHQHKMTQLHAKVRRNPHYPGNDTKIESNNQFLISMGFRRFLTRPIFSRVINGTEKTKYTKKIEEDYENYFYCSFYYYNYFPPAPVQVFRVNQFNTADYEQSPVMYGELIKCDPLHIILERIILTGYPFKINKRRSTVRFMFFNPKDVKYFKPIEVRTKQGKKGRIEESLGTHGYMKILFNDKVHQNDTVCMSLYRRVYPEPYF